MVGDVPLVEFCWQYGHDDFFDHKILYFCQTHFGRVLRGNDDRVDADWRITFVFDGDLAFAVGTQPVNLAILTRLCQAV